MDISTIISAAALIVSAIALTLSYMAYRDNHRHKRRFDTVEIIKAWDSPQMVQARAQMMQINDSQMLLVPEAIPLKDIMAKRKEEFDEEEEISISDHLNTLLNYMNVVAIGVKMGVYDKEMISHAMRQPFARIYFALEDYRNKFVSPRIRHKNPWKELTDLIEYWQQESSEELVPRSIPGGGE